MRSFIKVSVGQECFFVFFFWRSNWLKHFSSQIIQTKWSSPNQTCNRPEAGSIRTLKGHCISLERKTLPSLLLCLIVRWHRLCTFLGPLLPCRVSETLLHNFFLQPRASHDSWVLRLGCAALHHVGFQKQKDISGRREGEKRESEGEKQDKLNIGAQYMIDEELASAKVQKIYQSSDLWL